MDGLASLVALVSAVVFLIIALLLKQFLISLLLVAFIGSVCAFFLYNKPPAKIYLGDAGSMFLGGFLAAVPLLFSWSERSLYAHYAPLVILAVPLLEVFFLIVIRTWNGLPFYKGSPHHFSVYLQKKGWTKYRVLFFALCMEILFSFFAVLFIFNYVSFFSLLISCCILLFMWCYVIFTPLIFKDKSSSLRENLN
jgi:UDP-N-acetylmuramyl pentapeptide phosphotransferase/UDP-N-acetylglucosamine-1-phosphate transferase